MEIVRCQARCCAPGVWDCPAEATEEFTDGTRIWKLCGACGKHARDGEAVTVGRGDGFVYGCAPGILRPVPAKADRAADTRGEIAA